MVFFKKTPTEEVCNGNGVLTMNVSRTQAGAQFEFVIYKLPDVAAPFRVTNGIQASGPNFSVLEHVETAFPSGNYRIIATQTLGTETNQQTADVTIDDNKQNLIFTASERTICGGGEITVNVTEGNTSVFSVLEDCNNYRHTELVRFNGQETIPGYVFPLNITITVDNPINPGSPTIINDTWTSNAQNNSAYSIPFYSDQSYNYEIEVTDACGNHDSRVDVIEAKSAFRFRFLWLCFYRNNYSWPHSRVRVSKTKVL